MRRRTFLGSSGMALAAFGLGPALAGAAARHERISVGVIGTGLRGQELIAFLRDIPLFRVAACCDVLPFRLEQARALAGPESRAYPDYRRLLDDADIDAVVIATHFSAHRPLVVDALQAGKHVYCEKSMIKGIAETLQVVAIARENPQLTFQTGFQFHVSPLYRAALSMIERGDIGAVAAVDCQWNRNGDWRRAVPDPKWERLINWRMYREYSSGLVAELSAHQMNFCNEVLGRNVQQVQGVGGIDYWKDGRETYDNVHVVCRYRSGVTATFTSLTSNSLDHYRIAVLGKQGSIILTTNRGWYIPEGSSSGAPPADLDLVSGASVDAREHGAPAYRIDAPEEDPTPLALAEFGRCILDNRQPASNVFSGAVASIMVQAAIDAMDGGIVVRWRPEWDVAA